MRGFLRSLGALLCTNINVKLDKNKKPMVYPYYGPQEEIGQHIQRSRSKRELEREVIGSQVYLEIDNRECSQRSSTYFLNINEAASFIAAAHIKADLPDLLVSVVTQWFQQDYLLYVTRVAVVIILPILVLGMLAAKRKQTGLLVAAGWLLG